jgi:hypothetical protein
VSQVPGDDWDWQSELDDALSAAQQRVAMLESELTALRNTRTFRYTAMLRRPYSRLRQLFMPSEQRLSAD